jgi:hypothetical protein
MKALCVKEPWASKIRLGLKTVETRTWRTSYRGRVLFCASAKPKSAISGHAFAIVTLQDCVPMTREHEDQACCEVYPGAYAWILQDIIPINIFRVKGRLGVFDFKEEHILELSDREKLLNKITGEILIQIRDGKEIHCYYQNQEE